MGLNASLEPLHPLEKTLGQNRFFEGLYHALDGRKQVPLVSEDSPLNRACT
jgi:hypothetical protein